MEKICLLYKGPAPLWQGYHTGGKKRPSPLDFFGQMYAECIGLCLKDNHSLGEKMKKYGMLAAACGLFAAAAAPAAAQDSVLKVERLSFGLGAYDVLAQDDQAVNLRVDARLAHKLFWKFQPFAGLEATTDGSIWGGAGIFADFYISPQIVFTPSTAIGLYAKNSGKDLGGPVEFRTALELAYENKRGDRFGIGIDHKSNAGIHDKNPGTESVFLTYSLKF